MSPQHLVPESKGMGAYLRAQEGQNSNSGGSKIAVLDANANIHP
jgi:hypothetical protein